MSKIYKLIVEDNVEDLVVEVKQDSPHDQKHVKVKGLYIVTEVKNANGRIYHKPMMEKSVSLYEKEMIKSGRAYGELNHPESVEVNPDRVCHRITALTPDSNNWIGESVITIGSTCGDILKSLLLSGGKVGFSTRGVGDLTSEGIVNDYKLITVDAVLNPSAPNAFVEGILESKQYMIDAHGTILEMAYDNFNKALKNLPMNDRQKYVMSSVEAFINSIGKK